MQWLWWLPGVDRDRIGVGPGPYTALRERRHRRSRKPFTVSLLEYPGPRMNFSRLMAMWINDNSAILRAVINREVETADIVWTFTQDPLERDAQRALTAAVARVRPDSLIVNAPATYNAYHEDACFSRLERAGVAVPRNDLTPSDHGLQVVYKAQGEQTARKTLEPYSGPRAGYRAFEFVDGRGPDGDFRRYRAFHILGLVRPSKVLVSRHWNTNLASSHQVEYVFRTTLDEDEQIRRIAETLGLDYFAVDYVRRGGDGAAVFLDVNVLPTIQSIGRTRRLLPRHGYVHTFDTRARLGIEEPSGGPTPRAFDDALVGALREHRSAVADR